VFSKTTARPITSRFMAFQNRPPAAGPEAPGGAHEAKNLFSICTCRK